MASSRVGGGRVADGGYDPVAQKQAYLDKANVVTDESLASTRRMVGLIEESKESAVGTMVQLDEQVCIQSRWFSGIRSESQLD